MKQIRHVIDRLIVGFRKAWKFIHTDFPPTMSKTIYHGAEIQFCGPDAIYCYDIGKRRLYTRWIGGSQRESLLAGCTVASIKGGPWQTKTGASLLATMTADDTEEVVTYGLFRFSNIRLGDAHLSDAMYRFADLLAETHKIYVSFIFLIEFERLVARVATVFDDTTATAASPRTLEIT